MKYANDSKHTNTQFNQSIFNLLATTNISDLQNIFLDYYLNSEYIKRKSLSGCRERASVLWSC